MPRIREPGAEHALIPRDNRRPAICRCQICHKDKIRCRLPGCIAQGEIFLVDFHGQLPDLGG